MSDIAKMIAIAKKFGGGASGTAAPVVILEETNLTVDQTEVSILTPLSAFPEVGGTCSVTYNGTAYDCPVVNAPMDGIAAIALGNTAAMDMGDGNEDAPFVVVLFSDAQEVGEVVLYGVCVPMDGATSITLSIVQTEGGNATPSSTMMFNANIALDEGTASVTEIGATYEQCMTALDSKQDIVCVAKIVEGDDQFDRGVVLLRPVYAVTNNLLFKGLYGRTYANILLSVTPDGAEAMFQ